MDGTDVHGRLMTIKTHLPSCVPLNVQGELTHRHSTMCVAFHECRHWWTTDERPGRISVSGTV